MKHIYTSVFVTLAFIAACVPTISDAQCTCTGGVPATTIVNNVVLAPTNLPSASITVPQFNPTLNPGFDLSCVSLFDTLTGTTISGARNLNSSTALLPPTNPIYSPTGRMEYSFVLPITANVVGPGINQSKTWATLYGPDSLGAYGQPDDTITYGPTNIFSGFVGTKSSTNVPAYIGTGSVSLSYNILGNLNATEGSVNYAQRVTAIYSGNFGIVYYLCPSTPLATGISNFQAFKSNNVIQLQWLAANDQNSYQYEIQYSKDGTNFQSIANVPTGTLTAGTLTQYQYQYNPSATDIGELYFRVKRIEANGSFSYSIVKIVNMDAAGISAGIQVFPNPVSGNTINFQFDQAQTGTFQLQLVNLTGQIMSQKTVEFNGHANGNMLLDSKPSRGIYFLRARDVSGTNQFVTKVLVQ